MFLVCDGAAVIAANSYLAFDRLQTQKQARDFEHNCQNVQAERVEKEKRKHHQVSRNQISNTSNSELSHVCVRK